MSCSDKKFWLENLGSLFSSIQLVPHGNVTLAEQLNAITRLVLIIGVVMWLFNFKYGLHFLIISLVFIIIIYYIQKNTMQRCRENFETPVYNLQPLISNSIINSSQSSGVDRVTFTTGEPLPFCNDTISIDPPDPFAVGLNQSLAWSKDTKLNANPLTKIKPVVVPPAYDLESWRDNNLITYSILNSPGVQQDMYLSGYAESTCCGYMDSGTELVPSSNTVENYQSTSRPGAIVSPRPVYDKPYVPTMSVKETYCPGSIRAPIPVEDIQYIPRVPVTENYHRETEENIQRNIRPNQSGWVNTTCGYNPDQVRVGLPSNLAVGNCEQDPSMKQYNENLFTQIVTPGVYSINQVNEPINSNIGISFTQQFEPVTSTRDESGLKFTLHDPRIIEPISETPSEGVKTRFDNVYDPRFYGYGTSYRSYLEPVTGQTRFMYDDVNAIRMPNYVTRSKIDHLAYADHYGPMEAGSEFGNSLNSNIRTFAQDSWLRDSIQFREDLQQRLMRKINSEGWQKRMYPNSMRPVGSSCIIRTS